MGVPGASAAQNQIGASQQSFMNTLQGDFGTAFSGQQNIINGLTKSLTSTLNAGPSQYGFSAGETGALNTLATTQNATNYNFAKQAAGESAAAQGGGTSVLPNGSQGQQQAGIAESAAQTQSNNLLGIQEAGYKQGNQNYNEAVGGLTSAAGLENPNGLAGSANNAGEAAASTAGTIQKENAAASPWAQVGGLVGSLGGAAGKALTAGVTGGAGADVQSAGGFDPLGENTSPGGSPFQPVGIGGISGLNSGIPNLSAFGG